MTHPHQLHAIAAAWSVQAARRHLAQAVARETAHNTAGLLDAAPVASTVWGSRHALGGHSDPTGGTLTARPVRLTEWSDMRRTAERRITWIADQVLPGSADPLARILTAIPAVPPAPAAVVARHLQDEDTWIRAALALPPDRVPLTGAECPGCGVRDLWTQTAGPPHAWTVVCLTGCLCTGDGCGCGMTIQERGVAHIWPRAAVLGPGRGSGDERRPEA